LQISAVWEHAPGCNLAMTRHTCVAESLHHDLFPASTRLQASVPTFSALFLGPFALSAI